MSFPLHEENDAKRRECSAWKNAASMDDEQACLKIYKYFFYFFAYLWYIFLC